MAMTRIRRTMGDCASVVVAWFLLLLLLALTVEVRSDESTTPSLRGLQSQRQQERELIIGGERTSTTERFPYYAILNNEHLCGAVLIAPRFALTAAHCKDADVNFAFGSSTRRNGHEVTLIDRAVHPLYDEFTFSYDVALFELSEDAVFANGTAVPFLRLQRDEISVVNTSMTVIGYGDVDPNEEVTTFSDVLNRVDVLYVTNEECDRDHKFDIVSKEMMCAEARGRDACYGDSGGPLLLTPSEDFAEDSLVGIVSWGRGCADERFPGVYTRISFLYDWIVGTMCVLNARSVPPYVDCAQILGVDVLDDDDIEVELPPLTAAPTDPPTLSPTRPPTLPPTPEPEVCRTKGQTCARSTDCCSARCSMNMCFAALSTSTTNRNRPPRLSEGFGGSAAKIRGQAIARDIP